MPSNTMLRPDPAAAGVLGPSDVGRLGTILGVWAHPDDETFLSAGLMALAHRAGSRVVCVTATRGEAGTDDPVRWPPERLGAERARELSAALQVLGVVEHHWLDYPDGGCADVPVTAAGDRVAEIVAQVRPDTVVTFGPDGMTGHPDHVAVSRWTSHAVAAVGSAALVLQATTTPDFAVRARAVNDALQAFGPGLPVATARSRLAVALPLDDGLLDVKLAALRQQRSQTAAQERLVGTAALRGWWAEECFAADHGTTQVPRVGAAT